MFIFFLLQEPVSRRQCADIFWTGGLSSGNNRWFDKSVQIMCTKNGKAGLIGEHSMADGMPMIDLADYLTKNSYSDAKFKSMTNNNTAPPPPDGVENIFKNCVGDMFSIDSNIKSMVMKGMFLKVKLCMKRKALFVIFSHTFEHLQFSQG